jgi:hypothetical protein
MRRDFPVQIRLPVDALRNCLDDQIAIGEQAEVLLVVGGLDLRRTRRCGKGTRFELAKTLDGFAHVGVAVAILRRKLEEISRDAGVDEVRCDLRTHDACPEHRRFTHDKRCSGWHESDESIRGLTRKRNGRRSRRPRPD